MPSRGFSPLVLMTCIIGAEPFSTGAASLVFSGALELSVIRTGNMEYMDDGSAGGGGRQLGDMDEGALGAPPDAAET